MEIFNITDYTFTYAGESRPALRDVCADISGGEFVAVCGRSGSGKSTLLRSLKTSVSPGGERSGELLFCGKPIMSVPPAEQERRIGYVLQDPEEQLETGNVRLELSLRLERLGFGADIISMRVAETAGFFGIQRWFRAEIAELSGGQKQILNLAAIMTMRPDVLVLDEPTAQLDPIAALEFLEMLKKINRETGVTVIISEHRLEEVLPMADRTLFLDGGAVISDAPPGQAGAELALRGHDMFLSMPTPMRVFKELEGRRRADARAPFRELPITVRDGRERLTEIFGGGPPARSAPASPPGGTVISEGAAIELKDVWFRYDRLGADVVRGLSFGIRKGGLTCVVGGNGSGKSTVLKLIAGFRRPYRGTVAINGRRMKKTVPDERGSGLVAMLPQNPQDILTAPTIGGCFAEAAGGSGLAEGEAKEAADRMAALMELGGLLGRSPCGLSGGERQRAALGVALLQNPDILLLDEPTKGMDGHFKEKLAALLKKLTGEGRTVVTVSHDIEFCAAHADVCALFFNGAIVSSDAPAPFFFGQQLLYYGRESHVAACL